MPKADLIRIHRLYKYFSHRGGIFKTEKARIRVLNGIDLNIRNEEILGLAGESGCGKSTLAKLLIRLIPPSSGDVEFNGRPLYTDPSHDRKHFYRRVQMVFQDPYASLNPRMKIRDIIGEMLMVHGTDKAHIRQRVLQVLNDVDLDAKAMNKYPHEFSGGQRQRIAIARAIVIRPQLLIADEPVSALDLATQNRIIRLLGILKQRYALTILFISHDLHLIADFCDRAAIMYLGHLVEMLPAKMLMTHSRHPYVRALVESIPVSDPRRRRDREPKISGEVPTPENLPPGCPFHPRCPERFAPCDRRRPAMKAHGEDDHYLACHLYSSSAAADRPQIP